MNERESVILLILVLPESEETGNLLTHTVTLAIKHSFQANENSCLI